MASSKRFPVVSDRIIMKHILRKEQILSVVEDVKAEANKARPNWGAVAVRAKRRGITNGNMWRALDACSYVLEIFDPDWYSSIHRALEAAGYEKVNPRGGL